MFIFWEIPHQVVANGATGFNTGISNLKYQHFTLKNWTWSWLGLEQKHHSLLHIFYNEILWSVDHLLPVDTFWKQGAGILERVACRREPRVPVGRKFPLFSVVLRFLPGAVRICHAQVLAIFFQRHLFRNVKKTFGKDKNSPPTPGGRGTLRQHCRRRLTSRCRTLVQRHNLRSLKSPHQLLRERSFRIFLWKRTNLRKADMCSRQTGRIQNATRKQRSLRFQHRAVDKTGPRRCLSGSRRRPGERNSVSWVSWVGKLL